MERELIGGRYRVRSPVGQGGMGTVWLCEDELLRRDVAVKRVGLLPGESITDSARALREARTSAALSHRNVVTIFDVLEESGRIYLVMEYVPSRSLAELTREDGPLPPGVVARIGAQVADGLAAAHALGITHRDVKPGNVLVGADGTAKITDFGIARATTEPTLTQSGFLTGTPNYFAPELARGAHPDPSADVWALGATLYAAVEGRSLYDMGPNPVAVLHNIATTLPARPTRAGPLEQPLMRMLDRDPGFRWPMAAAAQGLRHVADQLDDDGTRQFTQGRPLTGAAMPPADRPGPPEETRRSSPDRGTTPPRSRRGRYVMLATALLVLIGGIAYATTLGDSPGQPSPNAAAPPRSTGSPGPTSHTPSRQPGQLGVAGDRPTHQGGAGGPTPGPGHTQAATTPQKGKVGLLRTYYSTVPHNLDAGWAMLGPDEKAAGRASYNEFWGSITSVGVSDITTSPGSKTADVSLTYHYQDGRVVDERQRLTLIHAADGRWLIDNDEVLSSTTR